jgi:hypothetical protein
MRHVVDVATTKEQPNRRNHNTKPCVTAGSLQGCAISGLGASVKEISLKFEMKRNLKRET